MTTAFPNRLPLRESVETVASNQGIDGSIILIPEVIDTAVTGISEAAGAELLESREDGWNWRVQLIRSGVSMNGNEYPLSVLHAAAPVYAGVPAYYGRGPDHNPNERGFDSVAGYITEATPNASGIEGTFEINRGKPEVRAAVQHAFAVQQRTGRPVMGFSHVVPTGGAMVEGRKPRGYTVKRISRVDSVDLVMSPAAGGGLISPLSESVDSPVPDPLQEAIMNLDQLLGRYRAGQRLTEAEWRFVQESMTPETFTALLAESITPAQPETTPAPEPTPEPVATPAASPAIDEATNNRIAELERQAQIAQADALLTRRLAEGRLPEPLTAAIRSDFAGRIFEAAELDARIERDRNLAAALMQVRPTGLGSVTVTDDQRDRHQKAMDGLIWGRPVDGVKPFLTLKEAWQQITGDHRHSYIDGDLPRRVLADMRAYAGDDPILQESIISSTFGDVLGSSLRRRTLEEFNRDDRATWRQIAPTFPVVDFRSFELTRWGGYGFLPVVPEGGTYQPLTSPGDEKATDSLDKYGGLEDVTMETIANDDMGLVRLIPRKLGYAAVDTLYNAVWNTTIKDNATASYDSVALYHASHGNTGTTALGEAGLTAVETAMRDQTSYGTANGLPLGEANMPRILAIPNELRVTAHKLVLGPNAVISAETATTPNMFYNQYRVIVVDSWTDANNWFAFADPSIMPAIQVGFFQGREEPELFVQDAQTVGSMFTADKVTYKIRHIWVIVVTEHRATYRQVVA